MFSEKINIVVEYDAIADRARFFWVYFCKRANQIVKAGCEMSY
jgi:hypothetical protein